METNWQNGQGTWKKKRERERTTKNKKDPVKK